MTLLRWRDHTTLLRADYRETLAACDGKADLVFTSPPYCNARTYGANVSWTDADYAALGDAVFAALRPGGHALINVDAPVREWRPGFGTERGFHPWRLMLDWAERVGFRVPDCLIFGRMGVPGSWPMGFRHDHEPLLWFQRPGEGYFDSFALSERASRGAIAGMGRSYRAADGSLVRQRTSGRCAEEGLKLRGSLWDYGPVGLGCTGAPDIEAQNHPARWPYKLAEDIVRCFCPPGGLACDPFLGAGTSMIAALEHGRRFVGGDLYVRTDDGRPWIDVAADVADARFRQARLFGGAP
jgi:DNA modification methylase